MAHGHDSLVPPWPDLVIASGRKCAGLALAIQRASRGRTFTVFVQNPRLGLARFDLIVAPRHDGITSANIFTTRGALSPVDAAALKSAEAEFAPTFADLPRPLVACLIGGTSRRHRLTPADGRGPGQACGRYRRRSSHHPIAAHAGAKFRRVGGSAGRRTRLYMAGRGRQSLFRFSGCRGRRSGYWRFSKHGLRRLLKRQTGSHSARGWTSFCPLQPIFRGA